MTNFQDLKDKPDAFLSLTGHTLEEFTELLPHFSCCFLEYMQTHTLDGKPRKNRRYKPYKNSRFASHEDMLLFILIYLRDAPKQVLLIFLKSTQKSVSIYGLSIRGYENAKKY